MACKEYQKLALEAALGRVSEGALRFETHCASCAACRAEFGRVKELLISMDRGVAEMVNCRPSDQFAAQLGRRLAESRDNPRAVPQSRLSTAACGLAVVALLALLFSLKSPAPHDANSAKSPVRVAAAGPVSSPSVAAEPLAPQSSYKPHVSRISPSKSGIVRAEDAQLAAPSMPEVIVPPQEWSAISRLAADAASGHVSAEPLTSSEVQSISPRELMSSDLPVFEIVSVAHLDAVDDLSSE
jgi:hypothetical protein